MAEKLQLLDGWLGQIFNEVDNLGIAENTLVGLIADNGLMYHSEGTLGLSQLIYRGGKTNHLEGGVRVDAFARWLGVIGAGAQSVTLSLFQICTLPLLVWHKQSNIFHVIE